MSKAKRGSKSHLWRGGKSTDRPYKHLTGIKYKLWRSKVFERDNWTCQTCRNRGNVIAHHIKFFAIILDEYKVLNIEDAEKCKELWDINNGVTLCPECHKIVHKKYSKYLSS